MLPIISFDNPNIMPCSEMHRSKRLGNKLSSQWFMCSQQSILTAMDRFVKSVNNMDATVLVPSKLRDMEIMGLKPQQRIPTILSDTDLHSFYLMLNDIKKELLWGPGTVAQPSHDYALNVSNSIINRSNSVASTPELKHSRQCSDDSLGSLGSGSVSSSVSDTESDADSMITDRDSIDEHTSHLAVAFRHHLQGLHSILHQLADSADYLSSRYQEDIEDS